MKENSLLVVNNLRVSLKNSSKKKILLNNISFTVPNNKVVAIVGESGSGKSLTALSILRLLSEKTYTSSGSIVFNKNEIFSLDINDIQKIRGNDIAMIFQEPMSALNPTMAIGKQLIEMCERHLNIASTEIIEKINNLIKKVKLNHIKNLLNKYPHEISGGQKQRIMIAMALLCSPSLLIADEPTTALDVTVQKEIIQLIKKLQKSEKLSVLFISHDLSLVKQIADHIIIMKDGKIIEQGTNNKIFNSPKELYTKALISIRPSKKIRVKELPTIEKYLKNQYDKRIIKSKQREQNHKKIYSSPPLLKIININKTYISKVGLFSPKDHFSALKKISLELYEGETLGLVGESGCGKLHWPKLFCKLKKLILDQLYIKVLN